MIGVKVNINRRYMVTTYTARSAARDDLSVLITAQPATVGPK